MKTDETGTSAGGIVAFGDEWGLPLILRVCKAAGQRVAVCVYDSKRLGGDWRPDGFAGHVLAHPKEEERGVFLDKIAEQNPSLGVIVSYSRILWPQLLDMFPHGVANIHGGKLPEYRGANVLQWAIINGEEETAATLHYVDEEVDTGPVIDAVGIEIGLDDTALSLREKMIPATAALLNKWLPKLVSGHCPATSQGEATARSWPRRTPEDGYIDWSTMSDIQVRNLARSLVPPWPQAYYIVEGKKVVFDDVPSLDEIRALRSKMAYLESSP